MATGTPGILAVDDELEIRELLHEYLTGQGCTVYTAADGQAMREVLTHHDVDVVVLDLRMPGEDGLSLARFLRHHYKVGIIMLTASDEVVDRIVGLEMGADDYLGKPFDPRELWARIKSIARRAETSAQPESAARIPADGRVRIGCCWLDFGTQQLTNLEGEPLPLTKMEFDLLQAFMTHPNRVLSREQLLDLAHDRDSEPFDRSIDIRITRLRRKIEENPKTPQIIQTIRGMGYMFVPPETT